MPRVLGRYSYIIIENLMAVFVGVYGNILDAQGAKGILDSSGSSDDDDDDEPQDEKSRLLKKKKEVSEMLRNIQ